MEKNDFENLKRDIEDIKALLIIFLQSIEVGTTRIGKALGVSSGRVSQLIDKIKYPRK